MWENTHRQVLGFSHTCLVKHTHRLISPWANGGKLSICNFCSVGYKVNQAQLITFRKARPYCTKSVLCNRKKNKIGIFHGFLGFPFFWQFSRVSTCFHILQIWQLLTISFATFTTFKFLALFQKGIVCVIGTTLKYWRGRSVFKFWSDMIFVKTFTWPEFLGSNFYTKNAWNGIMANLH